MRVVLVVTALLLAGCGDGGDNGYSLEATQSCLERLAEQGIGQLEGNLTVDRAPDQEVPEPAKHYVEAALKTTVFPANAASVDEVYLLFSTDQERAEAARDAIESFFKQRFGDPGKYAYAQRNVAYFTPNAILADDTRDRIEGCLS